MKQSHKPLALWIFIVLCFLAVFAVFPRAGGSQTVPFSEFIRDVRAGHVSEVKIREQDMSYTRRTSPTAAPEERISVGPVREWAMQRELLERNVVIHNEKEDTAGLLGTMLIMWLPVVVLVALFIWFMRQMQASGGRAMTFGKSKARLVNESSRKVTFDEVAGIEEAKDEVEEIIAFLKDPKKFRRLGGRIPKGVLLVGLPGTGKTLLARAIAGEAGVPFFTISGSDFVEMFVGVGASRVRDLFEQGKKQAPCIIFIDEIDAVGRHRGAGMGNGHDEREQTLNQLLVEMDGFDANDGVIIVAATNRADVLDPAILRPGRFDRRINVSPPDARGREQILKVHARNVPLAPDVDLGVIARGTPGFVGADLENLVNEAALLAARQDKSSVSHQDLEIAKDKVLMGAERKHLRQSEGDLRMTAFHEAGHALVATLSPGHDPIHKLTIVPRGQALGMTVPLPTTDRCKFTKGEALARVRVMLAGRAADELISGVMTTGASDDIKKASRIARSMVCEFGMSDALGPIAFSQDDEQPFVGRSFGTHAREYSDKTAELIDSEVSRIIREEMLNARTLIETNRDALDRLATALLERETLDSDEIKACVDGTPLPFREKVIIPTWSERRDKERADSGPSAFLPPKPEPT